MKSQLRLRIFEEQVGLLDRTNSFSMVFGGLLDEVKGGILPISAA